MDWFLEKDGVTIKVERPEFTVGRLTGDWQLKDDLSVSRMHASFTWNGHSFHVKDLGSKFGTWLDGRQLRPNVPTVVPKMGTLKFGGCTSEYRIVTKERCLDCSSELDVVKEIFDNGHDPTKVHLRGQKLEKFDRFTLLAGLVLKSNGLGAYVVRCGGAISEDGQDWTEGEILNAIVHGQMKTTSAGSMTLVDSVQFKLPDSTSAQGASSNVKKFKQKVHPFLDIISPSDMIIHQPNTSNGHKPEEWLAKESNKGAHLHCKTKPVESYFSPVSVATSPPVSMEEVKPSKKQKTEPFQSDFFKSLL